MGRGADASDEEHVQPARDPELADALRRESAKERLKPAIGDLNARRAFRRSDVDLPFDRPVLRLHSAECEGLNLSTERGT